ncbi:helix-turn-helix domain-containing protein [Desulfohalovibrio reitneri]|uniref:helix-turn-helix domain-containing protein n=1 Tax=Desulfohalovibrio reitneri TaxID=1307759 RepID=UPI00054EA68F|nr:helix-turn-helix domain-containing protein [Desulfohalovibrio reitneri]
MRLVLDLSAVDRERALRAWLVYHGIGEKRLAEQCGVTPSTITRLIKGQRCSRKLIGMLVDMGIPASLLPSPGPGPGRPRKTE